MRDGYEPITQLEDWQNLGFDALVVAVAEWREIRAALSEDSDELKEFNERLARQWSIETGIIEGVYKLTRGTTETLVEQGFKAGLVAHGESDLDEEELYAILEDQMDALDWVFSFVKSERKLSTSYIKELHALLTRHQDVAPGRDQCGKAVKIPLIKGDWKKLPNNPTQPDGTVFHYCPPEQVDSEMDNLVAWYQKNAEQSTGPVPPEVLAAWLHHRFVLIHPFQDGNGRVARALASFVFIKAGLFPLVVKREKRNDYINALKSADQGDLISLVEDFAAVQERLTYKAIDLANIVHAQNQEPLDLYSGNFKEREFLAGRATLLNKNAVELMRYAETLLSPHAVKIDKQLKDISHEYSASTRTGNDTKALTAFKKLNAHRKDLQTKAVRAESAKIVITEAQVDEVVFSAMPIDGKNKVFSVVSGIWSIFIRTRKVSSLNPIDFRLGMVPTAAANEEYRSYENKKVLTQSAFNFTAGEDMEKIKPRFREWFDGAMVIALAELNKRQAIR